MEPGTNPPSVAFVALSGTGKTTLLEKVVAEFKRRGYRIGALKHGPHGFDIDHPGKDSHRLAAAGADVTAIVSPEKLALVRRHDREPPVEEVLRDCFEGADLVLVEGYKRSRLPKVEVHRKALGRPLLCRGERRDPNLLAVVSDEPMVLDVPVFRFDEVEPLTDFLAKTLVRPGPAA